MKITISAFLYFDHRLLYLMSTIHMRSTKVRNRWYQWTSSTYRILSKLSFKTHWTLLFERRKQLGLEYKLCSDKPDETNSRKNFHIFLLVETLSTENFYYIFSYFKVISWLYHSRKLWQGQDNTVIEIISSQPLKKLAE